MFSVQGQHNDTFTINVISCIETPEERQSLTIPVATLQARFPLKVHP